MAREQPIYTGRYTGSTEHPANKLSLWLESTGDWHEANGPGWAGPGRPGSSFQSTGYGVNTRRGIHLRGPGRLVILREASGERHGARLLVKSDTL